MKAENKNENITPGKNIRFLRRLFAEAFTLSAFTFGGGYVIITFMQKRFVEKYNWLTDAEMLDVVAISQSAPGIIAINASVLVGYRLCGVTGAAVTALATAMPPLLTISLVAMFYTAVRDAPAVSAALAAMQAAVVAVIADAVLRLGRTALKSRKFISGAVIAASFAAAALFKVNVAAIILTAGLAGAVAPVMAKKMKGGVK